MELRGIYPPICTPFSADGELALNELRTNIRKYNQTGLAGYVPTGSTGESVFLTKEEKFAIWEAVCETAAPEKLVIAGTAAESVRDTILLTNAAADRGCHAALIRNPHYFKAQMVRPESQLTYYRAVADAVKIPVIIYNFPQVTGIDLPLDVLLPLAAHPNIIGIKESSANIEKITRLADNVPSGFAVTVGSPTTFYASLCVGSCAGILAFANAAPCAALAVYDAFCNGDHAAARAAQRRISDAATVAPRFGIQGLKYAMDLKGYYGGPSRLPLLPLADGDKPRIEELFRDIQA